MCGRFILVQKAEIIEKTFNISIPESVNYSPAYNISAGQRSLVVTSDNPHEAQSYVFGFTPFWAKKQMYLINARAEGDYNKENVVNYQGAMGIISKPAFRKAIRSQRCLVLADAFIEGTTKERLSKPYLIYLRDRKPFAFAGIWDEWSDVNSGEIIKSFAIITTVANSFLTLLPHHRSPVIIEQGKESLWLNGDHLDDVLWMLRPYPSEKMNGYPISSKIKSPSAYGRELIAPIGDRLLPEEKIQGSAHLLQKGMGRYKNK